MKLTWKSKNNKRAFPTISHFPNLPFEDHFNNDDDKEPQKPQFHTEPNDENGVNRKTLISSDGETDNARLFEAFQSQGNKLAEDGKYREALGKWEAALILMPDKAVVHEQKAQVLLEIGEAWNALKAATRATELEPSWAEAWITLGRAQLNFGEPDSAIESFDKALAIKPDSVEARNDRQAASHLVKRRKQLHSSGGLTDSRNRYEVGDETGS